MMNNSWSWIYRIGVISFLVMAAVSMLVAIGQALSINLWILVEGNSVVRQVASKAAWLVLICGVLLLWPCVNALNKRPKPRSTAGTVAWLLALLLFPFISPYLFYRKNVRNSSY